MLGRTAGALYWMYRYLERSENVARLVDAGNRISLTRADTTSDEWESVLLTAGARDRYLEKYDAIETSSVIDFLLRDKSNPSSVRSVIEEARNNARAARTALTREVWEATNECWMTFKDMLARPISMQNLPDVLRTIRLQSAIVRGALHGTMLRNEIFDFARIGTFLERADNTARILDIKYYVLLPSAYHVGSTIDNIQWDTILRCVSADHTYRWLSEGDLKPWGIADFLILDGRFPRSLMFCQSKICDNLAYLASDYGEKLPCHDIAEANHQRLKKHTIESILEEGLHEFVRDSIKETEKLGRQIEIDYRFYG